MKRSIGLAAAAIVVGSLGIFAAAQADQAPPGGKAPVAAAKVRIGTYDNRAIAVAYAASKFNPAREKMKEHAAAKQAGDAAKGAELEAWGKSHQRMLHFQGFGHVPVADLLEHVKDGVARVAAENQLAAITMSCDFVSTDAEIIDVTDELVELFDPTDKVRKTVRGVRDAEPVSLLVLADMPAEQ
jgi:hypothetical protein